MASAGVCGAAEFALVRDGKPLVEIVHATPPAGRAGARFQACVDDLAEIVKHISGAEIPIRAAADAEDKVVNRLCGLWCVCGLKHAHVVR